MAEVRKRSTEKIQILLVDDRQENLLALEAVLSSPDYDLIKSNSGDEALRYLLDHNPALILMDVQMPGLSGFEAAAIIKGNARTRDIPIIFITAINKDERFVHQGYDEGAVDYIYKPYDAHVLRSKVAVFAEIRRQHKRMGRLVAVQRGTTEALIATSDRDESISTVLVSICQGLEWDAGNFWVVDSRTQTLICHSGWSNPAVGTNEFRVESAGMCLSHGVDLPGRVFESNEALWIEDLSEDAGFRRFISAARDGLRTGVAFPVQIRGETLGIFEFFSSRAQTKDDELIEIMGAIGNQVCLALKRIDALEAVRTSDARKASILESALDCIISMDHEGRIIEFNPAAESTFGYNRSEVIGKEMAEVIIPPAMREGHRKGLCHYLKTGEGPVMNHRFEIDGMRSNHKEFPLELAITRVPSVEPPLFTGFLRDITDRKRVEHNTEFLVKASAVLASSLVYEETLQSLANLVVGTFADGCSIEVLEDGEQPYSLTVSHLDPFRSALSKELNENYPTDWNAATGIPQVVRTGKSELHSKITGEMMSNAAKDARHLEMIRKLKMKSLMIVPLVARGKTLGAVTFVTSESERQYTQDDLAVAEELARRAGIAIDNARLYRDAQIAIGVRDEFFSIASHELKTPITSLKMMLQMTRRRMLAEHGRPPDPEKLAKMLDTSNREVDRLTRLVEDLLDVTKIRAGKLEIQLAELNLAETIREVVERFSDALGSAKCSLELDLDPMIIGMWDGARIEQVVVNLLSNVIKYAPGSPIKIELTRTADIAKLTVQDSGPGIPIAKQKKIFERFERAVSSRNISGLGLGLFIIKQIVEAHQGVISVESQIDVGSTFTIELPLKPAPGLRRDKDQLESTSKAAPNLVKTRDAEL